MSLRTPLATAGTGAWLAFDTVSGLPVVSTISLGALFTILYSGLFIIERLFQIKP
jgi:hypothetical protein